MKWFVKHFADYHEIYSDKYKTIELGCFPVDGCGRYFGLFYKGRKPSVSQIAKSVLGKVSCEARHFRTGEDISVTKQEVIEEIKAAIKPN
jgi:hypothetical protein